MSYLKRSSIAASCAADSFASCVPDWLRCLRSSAQPGKDVIPFVKMIISTNQFHFALRLLLAAALSHAAPALSAVVQPPQVAVVNSLYQAFAYEAVLDEPVAPGFIDQPKEVLLRYLTPELFELIRRDRACTVAKHEICRLDFLPLWGNQDPSGTTVKFEAGASSNAVVAHLRIGTMATDLTYTLVQTKAGWRIDDIGYDDGRPSLKKLLRAKQ